VMDPSCKKKRRRFMEGWVLGEFISWLEGTNHWFSVPYSLFSQENEEGLWGWSDL